jgi:hypothetical protein
MSTRAMPPMRGMPPPMQMRGVPPPMRAAPIGYRGAPSGRPAVNLSAADTGAPTHNLYIKIVPAGDPDRRSSSLTLEALRYVHARLPIFKQMGINVKVCRVTAAQLANPRLVAAMKARGITRLPALTTGNNTYLGMKEISDLYTRNIKEFEAMTRRGAAEVEGAVLEDDDLQRFYGDEMTFERAEEDAQETGIGENDDMMESHRKMIERREERDAKRRPRTGAAPPAARGAPRAAPSRPPPAARPDNVGARRAEEDEADLIARLSEDIDPSLREAAMRGGGGDSYEDDDGGEGTSAQDDLMERAWLQNHYADD